MRARGGRLDYGSVRSQIAAQDCDSGARLEGFSKTANYIAIPTTRVKDVFPDGLTVHSQRVPMQDIGFSQFAKHSRQSARVKKIFHEVFAGRLNVDQAWKRGSQAIEIVEAQWHADPSSNRNQMDHRIRRSADGCVGKNSVFESLTREYLRHAQVLLHHLHDAPAGHLGEGITTSIHGGDSRIAGQTHAQGFHHVGHG